MLLLDHLAGRFLFKVKVAFDAEAEFTLEGLQLIQGKISPLVVPIPKDRCITEKDALLRIVFGNISGTCSHRIEKLGDDQRILDVLLGTTKGYLAKRTK
jgi:hypothetical protein